MGCPRMQKENQKTRLPNLVPFMNLLVMKISGN